MNNIDVNDLIYEQDDADEISIWRVSLTESSGDIIDMPAILNEDGTINHTETYKEINQTRKDMAWDNYRNRIPSLGNPAANVYVNGQIKRVDYLISETEGQELVDIIEQRFPAYELETSWMNVVGSYGPYRPPYTATSSISFYDMDMFTDEGVTFADFSNYVHDRPPHSKYNVDLNVYTELMPWFGYKFNLDDDTVSMKIVHRNRIPSVTYPPEVSDQRSVYYARIHNEDGTIDNMNDMFFDAFYVDVQAYCTEHNIAYPIPDEGADPTHVMVWGVVFNGTTGEPVMMKGYESRDVAPPT